MNTLAVGLSRVGNWSTVDTIKAEEPEKVVVKMLISVTLARVGREKE
jgi:hypothetical protein